jgi:RNA recognition motif-containing protein
MSKKLYIGNISYRAEEEDLRELFAQAGEVQSVKIITDAETGRSRGFGFVEMVSDEDAEKAIATMNGTELMGRVLVVNEARPQTGRGRTGGRGGQRGPYGRGRKSENWR